MKIKYVVRIFLFLIPFSANALVLEKGLVAGDPNWDTLTKVDRAHGYYPKAVVESDEDGVVYVYDGAIGKTNYKDNKLLHGWPLTRWSHHTGFEYNEPFFQSSEQAQEGGRYWIPKSHFPTLGCLGNTLLRYGDLENDGESELVLFLDNELVVFSPSLGKVVFSETYDASNWVSADTTVSAYEEMGSRHEGVKYYSISSESYWAETNDWPGSRTYSKIFQGDMDSDGQMEILVWRKLYLSNTLTESAGFKLSQSAWQRFEKDPETGEYLPQISTEDDIKTWLLENDLTWSKGYPSLSECAGEEGKLIPEMHDPLLNDPDVLQ
ncbi:MAG: hypothetical protein P8X74_21405 [Reinekea sp.]